MSHQHLPPAAIRKFFRWFCHPAMVDSIEGDLFELYASHARAHGKRQANIRFFVDVLLLFRPGIVRSFKLFPTSTTAPMYKSYLTSAWRNLLRQKIYSTIKVSGLALGIAASFLITLYILDELTYDKHIPDGDRIYRVVGVLDWNGELHQDVWFPAPFAKALADDYPEIESVGRINASELFGAGSNNIRRADEPENSYEEKFAYVDAALLDMIHPTMVYGNASTALQTPNSLVISRRKAEKFFPNENPVGKLMILNNDERTPLVVMGVMENLSHSHLDFDFLITLQDRSFWPGEQTFWRASNYHTYIKLRADADADELEKKVTAGTIEKYFLPTMLEDGVPDAEKIMQHAHLDFQPVHTIHLQSDVNDGLIHGDKRFIGIFGGIACFILLLACINFINLSTAKSANRAKEVGLRKVFGSFRHNLVNQFLTESFVFSLLACVAGALAASWLLPYFNSLANKSLEFPWADWRMYPLMLSVALVVGLLAGLYPSFYLSAFWPIQVLKGNLRKGSKHAGMRSALVVFQFTTSIILLIGTVVIYRQMDFVLNARLGYDKEEVLLLQGTDILGNHLKTFTDEMRTIPGVQSVSVSDYLPIRGTKRNGNGFWKEGRMKLDKEVPTQFWVVDTDYIKTLGIRVVAGRDFDGTIASDSSGVIVNQRLVEQLGIQGNPIGQVITNGNPMTILGVVEDFHFETLKERVSPLVMRLGSSPTMILVKVKGAIPETVAAAEKTWKKFLPAQPLRYTFLDQRYARMYDDVQRTGDIFASFATLAIVVACLGLFALSAFMIEQRAKEVSIRVVLGASQLRVFRLLTQDFIRLVLISCVLAAPLAWWLMQEWLRDFVYRIPITWDIFAVAGVLAVLIALVTISVQSWRASQTNPVNNLRAD